VLSWRAAGLPRFRSQAICKEAVKSGPLTGHKGRLSIGARELTGYDLTAWLGDAEVPAARAATQQRAKTRQNQSVGVREGSSGRQLDERQEAARREAGGSSTRGRRQLDERQEAARREARGGMAEKKIESLCLACAGVEVHSPENQKKRATSTSIYCTGERCSGGGPVNSLARLALMSPGGNGRRSTR
jgi:hypothetical protein